MNDRDVLVLDSLPTESERNERFVLFRQHVVMLRDYPGNDFGKPTVFVELSSGQSQRIVGANRKALLDWVGVTYQPEAAARAAN